MDKRFAPRFETTALTHPGKVRPQNEDAFLDLGDTAGLWAVADGMGGHHGGEYASRTVIEALSTIGEPGSAAELLARCEACVVEANSQLRQAAARQNSTIGTTLAVLLVHEDDYACVWSGDSRIYRLRKGRLAQLSRDHTEVQDLVERGVLTEDEARVSPRRNVITRAIGVATHAELEMAHGTIAPGDVFLLCSDGLTTHVSDDEIRDRLMTEGPGPACRSLLARALDNGGTDNVTIMTVGLRLDDDAGSQGTVVDVLGKENDRVR